MPLGVAAVQATVQATVQPTLRDAGAVRDTLDAVFRDPAFNRSIAETLRDRLGNLLQTIYAALHDRVLASPAGYWIAAVLLAAGVAYALGRGAMAWDARTRARLGAGAGAAGGDPWRAADDAAAAGRLVDAAHLLHAAVIDALARRGLVRTHDAKTVGDYARDLARRERGGVHAAYRDFARRYEPFVYAVDAADASRWTALRSSADATRAAAARRAGAVGGVA